MEAGAPSWQPAQELVLKLQVCCLGHRGCEVLQRALVQLHLSLRNFSCFWGASDSSQGCAWSLLNMTAGVCKQWRGCYCCLGWDLGIPRHTG